MCYMDSPVPRPVFCGWCGYAVILQLGLGCHGRPLSATSPCGGCPPSCPVWPCAGCSRLAIGPVSSESVPWVALLRGWLVCFGCDVL